MIRTGLCSITLRALAIEAVVDVAAGAGLECIEWGADVHVAPGDLAAAEAARGATEAAGLRVASYGSYHRAGSDDPATFDAVLESARALGAPRIRIWAGTTASADTAPAERLRVVSATRDAADRAAAAGIELAFEFHAGTLTDEVNSALGLLKAIDHAHAGGRAVATYWQPPEDLPDEEALKGLAHVLARVAAVHVFSWWPGQERLPLAGRADLWRAAFALLATRATPIDALLEFVPADEPDLVAPEAATLREWVEEAAGDRA